MGSKSVSAITATMARSPETVETWLIAQIESLADEWFSRCFAPQQRAWNRSRCPWCRRLRLLGKETTNCPICAQVARTRAYVGETEGPALTLSEPVYRPDHRNSPIIRLWVDYAVPARTPTNPRLDGRPVHEANHREWHTRITMSAPTPADSTDAQLDPFVLELARQVKREMRADPLHTMRHEA